MADYIKCKNCDSTDCNGCNIKILETMLHEGKFDCLMNVNHCINQSADVAPMRHGKWLSAADTYLGLRGWVPLKNVVCSVCNGSNERETPYCPNCGAKMDRGAD